MSIIAIACAGTAVMVLNYTAVEPVDDGEKFTTDEKLADFDEEQIDLIRPNQNDLIHIDEVGKPETNKFQMPESCDDDMIEHLEKYSNVFVDGSAFILEIGLPEGMSPEKFDICHKDLVKAFQN